MKKYILIFSLIVFGCMSSNAQIITSPDTAVCGSYEDTLQALSATQSSMAVDDQHGALLDIGFTFNFYGIPYTQLVVSGNGYVTFDISQANTGSPWSINSPIPNPGSMPENAIMAPWQDIHTGIGGSIFYGMTGVAPNRIYTITWCEVPMFSCTSDLHTSQVVLYEGSDKIEIFIQNKPLCVGWNSGDGIHGLVDATSTNFDIVTDPVSGNPRNMGLQWTAVNEGWEFLPNTPATSYVLNLINYVPIIAGANIWTDAGGTVLGTGPSLPVNISTSTTYFANITGACAFGNLSDSVVIIVSGCFDIGLSSNQASCLGNDATITCEPDTVLPLWDCELFDLGGASLQFIPNIIASNYTFANLFPGTYVVKASAGISASQDTIVVGQIVNPVTINSTPVGVTCYNGDDGQVGIWPSGGLAPYTFLLNGNPILNAFPMDSLVGNLPGGIYVVSAIDDNNCMMRDTVEITTPSHPLQALSSSKVAVCYGGNSGFAVGLAAGGSPGYTYSWYEGGNPLSISSNDTVFGLSAGSYFLEVEDANGCDTFSTVNVIEPQVALHASNQIFGVQCKGDATGFLVADAGGSWGPYSYYWLSLLGDTLQDSGVRFGRDTLSGLTVGSYILHIYDDKGCFIDYVLNVPEPQDALRIDSLVLVESIACYSDSVGKAIMYVSGGQPNYYYLWDNGETATIADGLTAGFHSVLLRDDWGCEVMDSIEITENPLIESTLLSDTSVSCYGLSDGVASISSFGGASSVYTYYWSQGQQTPGVNTDLATGLLQGSYYVTTRDALGCEVVDSVYISEPEPLSMEAAELDWIDCYNDTTGEAFAVATGGTESYVFSWDAGIWVGDTITTLTKGLHTVVVTDARGCTSSDTVVTHNPDSLYIIIDDAQTVLPYCVGVNTGSLSAIAFGGTGTLIYVWDDNGNLPQTSTTASELLADNYTSVDSSYTIIVTDAKGCMASVTTDTLRTFIETMEAEVSALSQYASGSLDSNEVSCFGYNDGSAEVVTAGGHSPYTYQWYGNGLNSTSASVFNLYSGIYSVTIRDTNNCMVNASIVLVEPSALTFNTSTNTSESCLGACDGEVFIDSLAGGVSPYSAYLTDNVTGVTTAHAMYSNTTILGVCNGSYTVSLTDVNACPSLVITGGVNQQVIGSMVYTEAEINAVTALICNGTATGSLAVLNPNTNPGYTYSWENINNPGGGTVSNTIVANNLVAGIYVLYADYNATNGCTASDTLEVVEYAEILNSTLITDVACYGESTGSIAANASGTQIPYTYAWSNGQTTATATNLSVGNYTLTVEDGNGCTNAFAYTVDEPQALVANITQNGYVLAATTPLGGTAPFSYSWREQLNQNTSIGTGISYTVSTNGTYYVIVTDANDCVSQSNSFEYGTTGVSDIGLFALSIYPNPFKEETTIDFGREIQAATVRVVDVFGKVIEEHTVTNTNKHILKRGNKASAIYFVEIEVGGVQVFRKLVIE